MRIAQIMAGAPQGGAELFFERMTLALLESGQKILPIVRGEKDRSGRLIAAGLRPIELRFGGPLDIFTKPKIATALGKFKADVAIAWMSRAAAKLPTGPWANIGRLGGYYDLKYFRACDYLIGNTNGIVNYINAQKKLPPERVKYLPNFVQDFGDAEPASRASLAIPDDAPLMLGLGRLHNVKGFDTLIEATALIPNAHCVIAGEGPERARLETLIKQRGVQSRVKLLGWRTDTGALLKAADIFVSSSRHEPLGNMVLEAFSAQTPVLAAKSEGPTEIINHGADGYLVPIDHPHALASAAHEMLSDVRLRVKLALAARQRFSAEFSRDVVVQAWLTFLQSVKK